MIHTYYLFLFLLSYNDRQFDRHSYNLVHLFALLTFRVLLDSELPVDSPPSLLSSGIGSVELRLQPGNFRRGKVRLLSNFSVIFPAN